MLGFRRNEICPYCFEPFRIQNTPFRCTSPNTRCAPEPDPIYGQAWGDSMPRGHVIKAPGRKTLRVRCDKCGHESKKRLCPSCHSELPYTTGQADNYVFAVIGAPQAGKSHYIAVLIQELQNRIGPAMDIVLHAMDDETMKRYDQDFYDPIYNQRHVIKKTQSAVATGGARPLLYLNRVSGKSFFGQEITKSVATLVFFDTAGEDLDSEDTMSTVSKYIYRSDGILLLIDPLQLQPVRDRLQVDARELPKINTESAAILTRTIRLIEKGRPVSATERIPIPLAVAFTKFDAVRPLVDEQFQLNATARHDGGFDADDFDAINAEMMAMLDEWGQQALLNQATKRFTDAGFFGLSALGCNPHATNQIPRVIPRRIEDPFLWLLYKNGLIGKARK